MAAIRTTTRVGLLSVVIGAAFALAACSSAGGTAVPASSAPSASAPSPAASPTAEPSAGAPAASAAASTGSGTDRYGPKPSSSTAASGATSANAVTVVDFGFNPGSITVKAGTTVTWTNTGVTHTVTSNTGLFDSGHLGSGDSFTFTFAKAGTYAYHCAIHSSMHGEVVVSP